MSLSSARRRSTLRTAGLALPACFVQATVSAALNAAERSTVAAKASRRRLLDKATKLAGVDERDAVDASHTAYVRPVGDAWFATLYRGTAAIGLVESTTRDGALDECRDLVRQLAAVAK